MIQDAERFILINWAVIEKAPLQTYASALVFSPTESLTRKCYSDQLPAWLVNHPTVQENWGNSVQTLEGHRDWVSAIAFSPDGKYLATGSHDNTVRLWDTATGALHSTLQGHGERVYGTAFSPKGDLASISPLDGTVRLWEPVTGVTSHILDIKSLHEKYPFQPLLPISFLPNDDLVVQDCYRNVRVWNRQNDSLSDLSLEGFTVHQSLAVSSQGRLALQAYREDSNEYEVLLYDSTTGAIQNLNVGSPAETYGAAFSPEGMLALGFSNGTIEIRDPTKSSYKELDVHSGRVAALSFSPDGMFLVSGSSDKTLRLWELSTQIQSLIGTHPAQVMSVAFSPDGKRIASTCLASTTVQIWEPFSRATTNLQEDNLPTISRVLFSPRGDQFACTSSHDYRIRLYDTATETLQFTLVGHSHEVETIIFSHDGEQLASASSDFSTRLWDPRTGSERKALNGELVSPDERINYHPALDFSPDGEQLASCGENNEVCILNTRTGHVHHRLKGHLKQVSLVRFSPCGKKVASVARDQTARLWDTMTGELLHIFVRVARYVYSVAFSPNGMYFACLSDDQSVLLYNLETGEPPNTTKGLQRGVVAMAFSGDSMSLASSTLLSGMVRDVRTVGIIGRFPSYSSEQLSFSSDGTYLKTERGHSRINEAPNDSSADLFTQNYCWRCDEEWLMEGDRKMLWLPSEYRTYTMAHHDGLFVLARESGGIVFLKVNQGEAVSEI